MLTLFVLWYTSGVIGTLVFCCLEPEGKVEDLEIVDYIVGIISSMAGPFILLGGLRKVRTEANDLHEYRKGGKS